MLQALGQAGDVLAVNLDQFQPADSGLVLVAGRFEGVDERVIEARGLEEVSIGDYVLSGGEIAIPVPQSDFRTTFEFKEFGVAVSFLPVVLSSGLINLKVDVTVSEITRLDPLSTIPLQLGTRKASSTVELREGQTMGLAGLINERLREAVEFFAFLRERRGVQL